MREVISVNGMLGSGSDEHGGGGCSGAVCVLCGQIC